MTARCPECNHPVTQHSREPDIGCLYVLSERICLLVDLDVGTRCPCTEPGTSEADQ